MADSLEHLAYGPDVPEHVRAAALDRLTKRVATTPEADSGNHPFLPDATETLTAGAVVPRRRTSLLVAIFAAGLLVGGATVSIADAGHPHAKGVRALPSSQSTIDSVDHPERLLTRAAATSDAYPNQTDGTQTKQVPFHKSTTRVIYTSPSGNKLWIAERAGSEGGYCLLGEDAVGSYIKANIHCAPEVDFLDSGISFATTDFIALWRGPHLTISPVPS